MNYSNQNDFLDKARLQFNGNNYSVHDATMVEGLSINLDVW